MIKTDVKISACGYTAEFRSDLGGNCYRLYHEPSKSELLRSPKDEKELFSEIYLFGNPILFPPNRIRHGKFTFEGREYSFPINEESTGCHIHGELYKTPFSIELLEADKVCFAFSAEKGEYLGFPHAFEIKRRYALSENGLRETVEVTNRSELNMPFMLAFHTTFNIPFSANGACDDCFLSLGVVKEQLRDENYLPTLVYKGGREREKQISSGGYALCKQPLSALYEICGENAVISDRKSGCSLNYRGDPEYRYRMLWRREGADFFVIEPQTCAIDCFHLEESAEKKGLIVLAPGETKKLSTDFFVK